MSKYKNSFEILARAIIKHDGKILLCQSKEKGHYFLPGGHVEPGENLQKALEREIREELGISVKKMFFAGVVENIFKDRYKHHEINIIFEVLVGKSKFESKESHISFVLIDADKLSGENVLPNVLKKAVLKWLKNGKVFGILS